MYIQEGSWMELKINGWDGVQWAFFVLRKCECVTVVVVKKSEK